MKWQINVLQMGESHRAASLDSLVGVQECNLGNLQKIDGCCHDVCVYLHKYAMEATSNELRKYYQIICAMHRVTFPGIWQSDRAQSLTQ